MKTRAILPMDKKNFGIQSLLLAVLLLFFCGMFFFNGPGVYNDSEQYLQMHIHREPLYPLFLKLLRDVFKDGYLVAMGYIQNIFMAIAVFLFTKTVSDKFSLPWWAEYMLAGIQLFPHVMTKYFSAIGLFVTNSVMSEALCMPLFTLWSMCCIQILLERRRKYVIWAWVLSLLLSLTRGQMMTTILVLFVLLVWIYVVQEKKQRIIRFFVLVMSVVLAFGLRTLTVKTYNLHYHGQFINNTYGNVNLLTNMLYASDRTDGEAITDEQARDFFYKMYDLAQEAGANYKFAGKTLTQKAQHIEKYHDDIKFMYIEDVFYQYYDKNVTTDYITQNLLADEMSMKIMKGIFPKCFKTWLSVYFSIVYFGLIRSIAVVHPVLNVIAMIIYLAVILLGIWHVRKRPGSKAVPVLAFALLVILANTCAVSLTIMCLSRYMIYSFSLFYTAVALLLYELIKPRLCAKLFQESKVGRK